MKKPHKKYVRTIITAILCQPEMFTITLWADDEVIDTDMIHTTDVDRIVEDCYACNYCVVEFYLPNTFNDSRSGAISLTPYDADTPDEVVQDYIANEVTERIIKLAERSLGPIRGIDTDENPYGSSHNK